MGIFWAGYMLGSMSIGRSFHVLLGANASSNLADGLAFVSVPLLAASLTSDPRLIAGLATVCALVRLLVALPIGVWVDRIDRRVLLAVANLLRGVAVLALAVGLLVGVEGLVLLYVRGRVNAGTRVLGLTGLAIGSLAGGALATIDLTLAVTAGGMVFVACTVLALTLIRTNDGQPPTAA